MSPWLIWEYVADDGIVYPLTRVPDTPALAWNPRFDSPPGSGQAAPVEAPRIVTDPATEYGVGKATIRFITDEPAIRQFRWRIAGATQATRLPASTTFDTYHSVMLPPTGTLPVGTIIQWKVDLTDAGGRTRTIPAADTSWFAFKLGTPPTADNPWVLPDTVAAIATAGQITVRFETDRPATATPLYSLDNGVTWNEGESGPVASHHIMTFPPQADLPYGTDIRYRFTLRDTATPSTTVRTKEWVTRTATGVPTDGVRAAGGGWDLRGEWKVNSSGAMTTTAIGATANLTFTGPYVELVGLVDDDQGSIQVSVDGEAPVTITLARADRHATAILYTQTDLSLENHSLSVRSLGGGPVTIAFAQVSKFFAPASNSNPRMLWSANLTQPLPAAFGWTEVDPSGAQYGATLNSSTTPEPVGRIFRTSIPGGAGQTGYKALLDLDRAGVASFPRASVRLTYGFRFTNLGSLGNNMDARVGVGLAGGAPGSSFSNLSLEDARKVGSWSARMGVHKPGYSGNPVLALSSVIYAHKVAGAAFAERGVVNFYRRPDGSLVSPARGRWYTQRVEIVKNTPGQENGRYRVWIDDELVQDLAVAWNAYGEDTGIGYLLAYTASLQSLTQEATVDMTTPRLEVI